MLAGFRNPTYCFCPMPNQHHPDKEVMGFYIPRTLAAKVRRAAREQNIPITKLIEQLLSHATKSTHLTPEDFREITQRKKHALRRAARPDPRPKGPQGGTK
jgi:hypothetical protein